jgi:hypothetical protein
MTKTAKTDKVPVNSRALVRREERRGRMLKTTHSGYFIIDRAKAAVVDSDADLETLVRRVGTLQPFERLVE